jgi:hypothetical protein
MEEAFMAALVSSEVEENYGHHGCATIHYKANRSSGSANNGE